MSSQNNPVSERFLTGKVALVTGGASGMGRAIATALAQSGAHVALGSLLDSSSNTKKAAPGEIVYRPTREGLAQFCEQLKSYDVLAFGDDLDVTDEKSIEEFFKKTEEKLGEVDILINAAGITCEHLVEGHSTSLWNKVMDVNSTGPFLTMRRALPKMKEKKYGRIINIASTAATVGAPMSGAYCASKAALVGLSKCVALEGAEFGITCNTISPGWVETDFGKKWMTDIAQNQEDRSGDIYIEEQKQTNPQKRMIQPSEIGALARYLCRPEAIGMTMQNLTVSAGSIW